MGSNSPSDPAGAETTHAYDLADRRIETARPEGGTWVYAYGAADRLVSVADPESNTTTYVYDPDGNRTEQTDARQHTTRFEFDQRDRLELRRYHVGPAKFDSTPGASSPVHTRLHPHVFEKDQCLLQVIRRKVAVPATFACARGFVTSCDPCEGAQEHPSREEGETCPLVCPLLRGCGADARRPSLIASNEPSQLDSRASNG